MDDRSQPNGLSPSGKARSRRPTIGVLVDWLEDDYQTSVFCGALAAAQDADVNLICFTGGVLDSPDGFGARRNGVYDLANAQTVDGLVILSGTIGNHIGPAALARYCARYQGLPMANVGVALPGIPSFLVDNAAGLAAAIRHLIEVHGLRRIAFVRGPEVNDEAQQRFQVYRDTLARCGLPYDPDLVTPGNFQALAGASAVRTMLDERKVAFDAIVAANDDMALGAMEALQARQFRIPEQVAVVGFDDVENARFAAVPMATVRQPLWEQGRLATNSVIMRIRGGGQDPEVVLPSEFVPRRSCGCGSGKIVSQARCVRSPRGTTRRMPARTPMQPSVCRACVGLKPSDGFESCAEPARFSSPRLT